MDETDIRHTARRLIAARGVHAHYDAVARATELKAQGNDRGATLWLRIFDALQDLEHSEPPTRGAVQ